MKYRIVVSIKHITDQVVPRELIFEIESPLEVEAVSEALERAKYINAEELRNINFSFTVRKE